MKRLGFFSPDASASERTDYHGRDISHGHGHCTLREKELTGLHDVKLSKPVAGVAIEVIHLGSRD